MIIPRAQHPISRALISENALKVLHRLKETGFASLLVGGCVRDLMLGREPKDFDVVTDASPEEIRTIFRNARLIGRRFRLAHVRFGREIIEVATFRALPRTATGDEAQDTEAGKHVARDGRLLRDNVFGSQEEDALRRDFTINALYYDIRNFSVMDYVGGATDLQDGWLRIIGDPETRFREDAVRMLRAVRFAAKLGFKIEPKTAAPIRDLAPLLVDVPAARMFEEVLKLFHGGYALETYELLRHYDLFRFLFPATEESLAQEESGFPRTLVAQAFGNTDARIAERKPVTPAFLFAALLWHPVKQAIQSYAGKGMNPADVMRRATEEVLRQQIQHVSIPKRFSVPMREIWDMQSRFERRSGMQPQRLLQHPRFRAAYDFMLLRAASGDADPELAPWWTEFQEVDVAERKAMVGAITPAAGVKKRRKRRHKRKTQSSSTGQ